MAHRPAVVAGSNFAFEIPSSPLTSFVDKNDIKTDYNSAVLQSPGDIVSSSPPLDTSLLSFLIGAHLCKQIKESILSRSATETGPNGKTVSKSVKCVLTC